MKYLKKQPCPTCGTRSYKKSSEGYFVCRYGHQMLGWQEEEGEETGFASSRLKRKKIRKATSQDNSRLYGADRLSAFYRIFQLGLQTLATAFVHDLGLPAEFENIVREFWLLYVSNSKMELSDAYKMDEPVSDTQRRAIQHDDFDDLDEDDLNDVGKVLSAPTHLGTTTSKTIQWPVLRFHHTLVLCYLSSVWLKWPIMLSDIRRWCVTLQLPYLKILKSLPNDLVARLDMRSLKHMVRVPNVTELQSAVNMFAQAFEQRCGLTFPDANIPLMMHRCCAQFFLPVEMYFCALHLYDVCQQSRNITSSFHHTPGDDISYYTVETRVMLTVLVMVKLCYVLDDQQLDTVGDSPVHLKLLPKKVWLDSVRANAKRWQALYEQRSVESSDAELGLLLDYFHECVPEDISYTGKQISKNMLRNYMTRLSRETKARMTSSDSEKEMVSDLYMHPVKRYTNEENIGENAETRQIGDAYVRYSLQAKSMGKSLHHKEYELVVSLAARFLGVSIDAIHSNLTQFEVLLQSVFKQQKS